MGSHQNPSAFRDEAGITPSRSHTSSSGGFMGHIVSDDESTTHQRGWAHIFPASRRLSESDMDISFLCRGTLPDTPRCSNTSVDSTSPSSPEPLELCSQGNPPLFKGPPSQVQRPRPLPTETFAIPRNQPMWAAAGNTPKFKVDP